MYGDFPSFITTNIWGEVFGGRAWLDLHLWAIHTFATCWDFFLRPKKRSCFCGFCLFFADVFFVSFCVVCVFWCVIGCFLDQLTWNAMKRHVLCQLNMSQPTDLTLFIVLLIVWYMRWPIIMLKFLWLYQVLLFGKKQVTTFDTELLPKSTQMFDENKKLRHVSTSFLSTKVSTRNLKLN